jgi:hypothetical protein
LCSVYGTQAQAAGPEGEVDFFLFITMGMPALLPNVSLFFFPLQEKTWTTAYMCRMCRLRFEMRSKSNSTAKFKENWNLAISASEFHLNWNASEFNGCLSSSGVTLFMQGMRSFFLMHRPVSFVQLKMTTGRLTKFTIAEERTLIKQAPLRVLTH